MDYELLRRAEKYRKRHRKRSVWKQIMSFLGCVVVFCTTYALILPAITQEVEPPQSYCGQEAHVHTESCYVQVEPAATKVLACPPRVPECAPAHGRMP